MFFRVLGNRASPLKIEYLAAEVCTELSHAAGAQVSSGTCAEAIWAQWQDRGQAGEDSGRAGTIPWGETYFSAPQSRCYKKDKHQRRREVSYSAAFSREAPLCQGLSHTRELSHMMQKRLWSMPPTGASVTHCSVKSDA